MIKVKMDWLFKITGYAGTTIAPFVFYKTFPHWYNEKHIAEFWNHEGIHIKQQYELFIIGFYVLYLYYYIKNRRSGMDHDEAYRKIPFEMEAYDHESDLKYLDKRKKNAWKQYR